MRSDPLFRWRGSPTTGGHRAIAANDPTESRGRRKVGADLHLFSAPRARSSHFHQTTGERAVGWGFPPCPDVSPVRDKLLPAPATCDLLVRGAMPCPVMFGAQHDEVRGIVVFGVLVKVVDIEVLKLDAPLNSTAPGSSNDLSRDFRPALRLHTHLSSQG